MIRATNCNTVIPGKAELFLVLDVLAVLQQPQHVGPLLYSFNKRLLGVCSVPGALRNEYILGTKVDKNPSSTEVST